MGKNNAAKTTDESTAIAVADESAALAGLVDELGLEVTGLEEAEASDIQIAAKVLNFKKKTQPGEDPIPANHYYDTLTETPKKKLRLQLLNLHKTHEWREFVQAENKSYIRCRSFDRETGRMEDGTERPCDGCPDRQWETDPETKKRSRRCGDVWNMGALDLDEEKPCVVRFKRTSLPVVKAYLNKHHLRRRKTAKGMADWPLFFFECVATAKMSENGVYAIPILERGDVLSKEQITLGHESAKYLSERAKDIASVASEKDVDDSAERASSDDTSFDPGSFVDSNPQSSGQESASNRF